MIYGLIASARSQQRKGVCWRSASARASTCLCIEHMSRSSVWNPLRALLEMAQRTASRRAILTKFIEASAESIPVQDRSIDTIVTTWTLCSIPDVGAALREMRRVLKPEGQLLFVEHGLALR